MRRLSREKYLTEEQFKDLLRSAGQRRHENAERDRTLFLVAGEMGLRSKEVVGIRVKDCDKLYEDPPAVEIRTAKRRRTNLMRGKKDEVGCPPAATRALKRWLKKVRAKHGDRNARVFPVSERQCRRLFAYYAKRAGILGRSFHSLRHYKGMQLYEATKDILFTRDYLRHTNINSTLIYARTLDLRRKGAEIGLGDIEGEEE